MAILRMKKKLIKNSSKKELLSTNQALFNEDFISRAAIQDKFAGAPYNDGLPRGSIVLNTVDESLYVKIKDRSTGGLVPDVLYWKLNEASGTTVADSSGASFLKTGTASAAAWTTGKFNNGYDLGNAAAIRNVTTAVTHPDFIFNKDSTIMYWAKWDGVDADNVATVFCNENGISQILSIGDYGNNLRIGDWGVGNYQEIGMPSIVSGVWGHFAVVLDKINLKIYIYKDGILNSTTTWTKIPTGNQSGFRIGLGDNDQFDGVMDDVKVWNRTMSQTEIQKEMLTEGATGNQPWGRIKLSTAYTL